MASNFGSLSKGAINLDHVAFVENTATGIRVHLALPVPQIPGGVTYPMGSSPPVATGHLQVDFDGEDARKIMTASFAAAKKNS